MVFSTEMQQLAAAMKTSVDAGRRNGVDDEGICMPKDTVSMQYSSSTRPLVSSKVPTCCTVMRYVGEVSPGEVSEVR